MNKIRDLPLENTIKEYGQYRDVSYIDKSGEAIKTRCLIVPAKYIEPVLIT